MSRGGRGGGRGGFGGSKGPGDGLNMAGMTYAEISAATKSESTELYPEYPHPFPTLPAPSLVESAMVRTQIRFGWDMALGHEFLRESRKGDDIVRYTDKYKTAEAKPTTLDPKDYAPRELQPQALYDSYYTPEAAKKRAAGTKAGKKIRKKANLDDILSGEDGSGDEAGDSEGDLGSQEEDDDYDADEGDDDYGDNYFDNGEDDDGGDDGGGGGDDGGTFD